MQHRRIRDRRAVHEAGHAAVLLALGYRCTRLTILPSGDAAGYTIFPPIDDPCDDAIVDMGGTAAVLMREPASNDIALACRESVPDLRLVLQAAQKLKRSPQAVSAEALAAAGGILMRHFAATERLRQALLAADTLDEAEILRVFRGAAKPDARKHHRRRRRVTLYCDIIPCDGGRLGILATRPGKPRKRRRRPEG